MIVAAFGFVLQVVVQVFVYLGNVVAMQMGLGFASMIDPQSGITVPIVSQFYLILCYLLFFAMNAHLQMIDFVLQSFSTFPLKMSLFSLNFP